MENDVQQTLLVTGFGPFGKYEENPSWKAVQLLPKLFNKWEKSSNFKLVIEEIPVAYKHVSERMKELWKLHKPSIIINVGVSCFAKCLTLECQANSKGFNKKDIFNECPLENEDANETLKTKCDIDKLCELINQNSEEAEAKACLSNNAGRYLCEYIYYHSLCLTEPLSLFIHIPTVDVYTSEKTAQGIFKILTYLTEHFL